MVFRPRGLPAKERWFRRRRPSGPGEELNPNVAGYQRLNPRLKVVGGIAAVVLLVLAGGLAWRQVILHPTYLDQERQQILRRVIQPGPRGELLDRKGRPLVANRSQYSVVLYVNELRTEFQREFNRLSRAWHAEHDDDDADARPTINRDQLLRQARSNVAQGFLDKANSLLGRNETLDAKHFEDHFQKHLLLPFTLIANLSPQEYARFNEQMPVESPLQTYVSAARQYPYGSLAAHTLGFVGTTTEIDDTELPDGGQPNLRTFSFKGKVGRDGLELSHDDRLKGIPGGEIWIVGPSGFKFVRTEYKAPQIGETITTSLDLDLQRVAEKALEKFPQSAAVALDVRTGEVLVMASNPDYDLNGISTEAIHAQGGWLNRASQGLYPPGSTFKLIDTIAGLRAGMLDASTRMQCGAELLVGNRMFKENIYPQGYGDVDLITALQKSCNVFFYQQGLNIGPQLITAEARRLGLDKPTGIDISETRSMNVPQPVNRAKNPWTDGDTANLAIGQGELRVTPLQMACLIASLARDQTRTRPTLLHAPEANAAQVNDHGESLGLKPEQRQLLLTAMEKVITAGTGKLIQPYVPGIRVAGKTGTAQTGQRLELTVAWVVCFAPIEDPQVAVAVAIESTTADQNYHGGQFAGPVAGAILQEYFKQYPLKK